MNHGTTVQTQVSPPGLVCLIKDGRCSERCRGWGGGNTTAAVSMPSVPSAYPIASRFVCGQFPGEARENTVLKFAEEKLKTFFKSWNATEESVRAPAVVADKNKSEATITANKYRVFPNVPLTPHAQSGLTAAVHDGT